MMIKYKKQSGFTIIELMIAISVLAVLLLMSTVVMMGIGSLYSKGIDMTNVQNVSRNVIQDLTSTVQFSGQNMLGPNTYTYSVNGNNINVTAICFGATRYSYVIGFPPNNNVVWPHIIWKDTMDGQNSCSPLDIGESTPSCDANHTCLPSVSGSGSEMIGSNMHLAYLTVKPYNQQLYSIQIGLVYGFKDMFKTASNSNNLATDSQGNYICSNTAQYCAVSSLSTLATEMVK